MFSKDSGTRNLNRMPVVTFVLMGLIAFFFLIHQITKGNTNAHHEDAISYYVTHGYLRGDVNLSLEISTNGLLALQWLKSRDRRIQQYKENRRLQTNQRQDTNQVVEGSEDQQDENSGDQEDEGTDDQAYEDSTSQQGDDSGDQQDSGSDYQQAEERHFDNQDEELYFYQTHDHSFDVSDKLEQAHLNDLISGAFTPKRKGFSMAMGFQPKKPKGWATLTFPLAHHGTYQVLIVLLMMYLTAPYVEDRWGRWFLPALFYGGSFTGLLVSWKLHPSLVFYGAECGVTTVLAAYLVRYPNARLRFPFLIPILDRETYSPVWMLVLYWGLLQKLNFVFWYNITGSSSPGFMPLVAAFALGIATALAIRFLDLEKYLYQTEYEKLSDAEKLDYEISYHRGIGDTKELLASLQRAYRMFPDREDYQREYWTQAVRMNCRQEALPAGKLLIAQQLDLGEFETAYFHWRELTEGKAGENLEFRKVEELAAGLVATGHHFQARDVLAYTIDHLPVNLTEQQLAGLLELARSADPHLALSAVDRLLLERSRPSSEEPGLRALRADLLAFHPEIKQPPSERQELELALDFPVGPEDPFAPTRIAKLKIYRGVLQAFHDTAFDFTLEGHEQLKRLPFDQVKAIWAAAIRPIGDAPDLLLDLHLDDPLVERPSHRILRLMGRELDPLRFIPGATNRAQAVRDMVRRIIDQGRGAAMPSREALLQQRFPVHATIADFEATAYGVVSS